MKSPLHILCWPFFALALGVVGILAVLGFAVAHLLAPRQHHYLAFFLSTIMGLGISTGAQPTCGEEMPAAAVAAPASLTLTDPLTGDNLTDDEPDGSLPAAATLAQLPEATPSQIGNWMIGLMFALNLGLVILAFTRKQPDPFRVVQGQRFADHEQTKETLAEIKAALKEVSADLQRNGTSQYNARRRMHRKINHMSNALHFLAGEMFGSGDERGQRLRALLEKIDEKEDGDDE